MTSSERRTWSRSSDGQWGDAASVVTVLPSDELYFITRFNRIRQSTDSLHKAAPLTVSRAASGLRSVLCVFRKTETCAYAVFLPVAGRNW